MKGANRQVENTIRTIKESQAEKEKTSEARKELQNFLGALAGAKLQEEKNKEDYLENKLKKLAQHKQKEKERKAKRGGSKPDTSAPVLQDAPTEKQRTGPLSVGEKVRIKDNGMVGEVSLVSNKAVTVIVGNVSTKMPLSKVERISSNEYRSAMKEVRDSRPSTIVQDAALAERKLAFKPEIDVRGERVNDALEIVMKFIDDAIMLNMSSVRIVHGKGTGALRDEIQRFVKATPGVASVKDEHIQFGGTGVTIVTFE